MLKPTPTPRLSQTFAIQSSFFFLFYDSKVYKEKRHIERFIPTSPIISKFQPSLIIHYNSRDISFISQLSWKWFHTRKGSASIVTTVLYYNYHIVTPQNPGVPLTTRQRTKYLGIAYRDNTISFPIHWDPFMPIYFRKIYIFIKTVLILHVKSSFFTKRFLKATVRLSSHLQSQMRVSHLYITCT